MHPAALIAIAIVAVCWLLQWPLQSNIRATLKEHHPETYESVIGGESLSGWGLTMFMLNNDYKRLDDPAISRGVLRLKLLGVVAAVAVVIAVFATA